MAAPEQGGANALRFHFRSSQNGRIRVRDEQRGEAAVVPRAGHTVQTLAGIMVNSRSGLPGRPGQACRNRSGASVEALRGTAPKKLLWF